jgi:hypothetical protein
MRLAMRLVVVAVVIVVTTLACRRAPVGAPTSDKHTSSSQERKAQTQPAAQASLSGVYGFSGARVADSSPQGVIGECVWIFDAGNTSQVAKGNCTDSDPGNFHVALMPGHYVVRGPGGNKAIEVKKGHWVKVTSIVPLPMMP